jgi:hypothetical protein
MALLFVVALAALLLEDQDLLGLALCDDVGLDRGALDEGSADLEAVTTDEQDLIKLDLTVLGVELLYTEGLTLADAVLFTARLNDRVHRPVVSFLERAKLVDEGCPCQ